MKKPDQKVINAVRSLQQKDKAAFDILQEYIDTEYTSIISKLLSLSEVSDFRFYQGIGKALGILNILLDTSKKGDAL